MAPKQREDIHVTLSIKMVFFQLKGLWSSHETLLFCPAITKKTWRTILQLKLLYILEHQLLHFNHTWCFHKACGHKAPWRCCCYRITESLWIENKPGVTEVKWPIWHWAEVVPPSGAFGPRGRSLRGNHLQSVKIGVSSCRKSVTRAPRLFGNLRFQGALVNLRSAVNGSIWSPPV